MASSSNMGKKQEQGETSKKQRIIPRSEQISILKGPKAAWLDHGVLKIWSTAKDPERIYDRVDTTNKEMHRPLDGVIHLANVWIRACNHNAIAMFQDLEPWIFDDDEWLTHYMSNPPRSFLDACPGHAKVCMKEALRDHPLLSQLFTTQEIEGIRSPADLEAEREYWRADGIGGFASFLDGAAVFSSTDTACSWVVWALNQVVLALWQVAWKGISLETLVPAELEPLFPHEWSKCQEEEDLLWVTMSEWLEDHRDWFGPLVEVFHRVRADVLESTIASGECQLPSPAERQVLADKHLVRLIAEF